MSTQQRRWILSGGLASGKSLVRRLFDDAGVTTIDADSVGHEVLEPGGPAFDEVAARWPGVLVDGVIDRQALARIVFNDPQELLELETVTHPSIFSLIKGMSEGLEPLIVVEMPLLGNGLGAAWSRIVVDCRDEVRLERAISRGLDRRDAIARMARQPTRREWLAAADLVIPNHGGVEELIGASRTALRTL